MGLTNEEHLIFVRLEKILDSMSVTIKEIKDKLEVRTDKLSPKIPEPITPCDDKDYVCVLKQFLLTKSELTREDKVGSGLYILHDIQVTDESLLFKNDDHIDAKLKPGSYVLFVSEKMLYICGDDSGVCTYLAAHLDPGVSMLASALKHGMLIIKGFSVIKEASNE